LNYKKNRISQRQELAGESVFPLKLCIEKKERKAPYSWGGGGTKIGQKRFFQRGLLRRTSNSFDLVPCSNQRGANREGGGTDCNGGLLIFSVGKRKSSVCTQGEKGKMRVPGTSVTLEKKTLEDGGIWRPRTVYPRGRL